MCVYSVHQLNPMLVVRARPGTWPYKIFVYFEAVAHESIILSFPPPHLH